MNMICDITFWHHIYNAAISLQPFTRGILSTKADAAINVQTNTDVSFCSCSRKSEGEKASYIFFFLECLDPLHTTLKPPTMSRPWPAVSEHDQTTAQGARAFQWPKENTRHAVVSHVGSWMISKMSEQQINLHLRPSGKGTPRKPLPKTADYLKIATTTIIPQGVWLWSITAFLVQCYANQTSMQKTCEDDDDDDDDDYYYYYSYIYTYVYIHT